MRTCTKCGTILTPESPDGLCGTLPLLTAELPGVWQGILTSSEFAFQTSLELRRDGSCHATAILPPQGQFKYEVLTDESIRWTDSGMTCRAKYVGDKATLEVTFLGTGKDNKVEAYRRLESPPFLPATIPAP